MTEPQFLRTTTVLPVRDIYETVEWYEQTLGLQTRYIHGRGKRGEAEDFANYATMTRDSVEVHFILDEEGPIWTRSGTGYLALTVRDVELEYSRVKALGILPSRELKKQNWNARGFSLQDPSGNEILIQQPIP
jgi:uncharacterized glyoxalase superfamily protein PhnB